MNAKKLGVLPIILTLLIVGVGSAIVYMTLNVTMTANVKTIGTIGIYSDSACTVPIASYGWGEFDPSGGSQTKILNAWIKNIGNTAINATWILTDADLTWTNMATEQYFVPSAWELHSYKDQSQTLVWHNSNSTDNGLRYVKLLKGASAPVSITLKAVMTADPSVILGFNIVLIAESS